MKGKSSHYSSESEDNLPLDSMRNRSSDSEDSMPIGSIKSRKANSYSGLSEQALVQCEFCDQLFNTRLASIKHNATHIIIPLLKLTLHQCDECLFHFTSLENLRTHATSKNHETSQLSEKSHLKSNIDGYEKILQSIVEKQVIVKCHDTLSEVLCPKRSNISIPVQNPKELNSNSDEAVYLISSDSEDDGSITDNKEIKQSNQERESNPPERENDSLKKDDSNLEKHNGHLRKSSSPEKDSNPNRENGNPEREFSSPERENGDPERENDNIEHGRSSPFNSSYLEMSSPSQMKDLSSPLEPISHRIIFEDDIDDDIDDDLFEAEEILPDKPYYPVKNSFFIGSKPHKKKPIKIDIAKSLQKAIVDVFNNSIPNSNIFGSQTCTLNGTDENEGSYGKSVHYDELVKPQICDCRYCGRCFGNRLELIKHESTHMRARAPRLILCYVCERFLGGNHWTLRKHMQKYHPDNDNSIKPKAQRCTICHLAYYNYNKHVRYYHQGTCHRYFDQHIQQATYQVDSNYKPVQSDVKSDTQVIKLCEICLAFAKNKQNVHYEVICEHSEVGTRHQCDRCHNICFEVSLVRRKVKLRENPGGYRRKPMSNKERLKKMQNRLKMVNKMNKC